VHVSRWIEGLMFDGWSHGVSGVQKEKQLGKLQSSSPWVKLMLDIYEGVTKRAVDLRQLIEQFGPQNRFQPYPQTIKPRLEKLIQVL